MCADCAELDTLPLAGLFLQHEDDCTGYAALPDSGTPSRVVAYRVAGARINFTQLGYDAPVILEWRGKSRTFATEALAIMAMRVRAAELRAGTDIGNIEESRLAAAQVEESILPPTCDKCGAVYFPSRGHTCKR